MATLDDIIKSSQWARNMHKILGQGSMFSEMMKTQERLTSTFVGLNQITELSKNFEKQQNSIHNLTGINMLTGLAKSIHQQERFLKNMSSVSMVTGLPKSMQQQIDVSISLSAIDVLTKSIRIAIPQATIDTITSINRQHYQLFGNLRNIADALTKNQSAISQINNWQSAFSSISGRIAFIAATQRKWDLIEDVEEITEEAVSLHERIFNEDGVTKEGLNELRAFFQRIEVKVDKIDANASASFWKLLAVLGFILTFMGEARNWLPKPEYATKQEVETLSKTHFSTQEKKLKEEKSFRITTNACKVMAKPKLKSFVIERLPVDFEVTVIQVNHKWMFVSYFSPIDNLPHTGWILKKYLAKPEK